MKPDKPSPVGQATVVYHHHQQLSTLLLANKLNKLLTDAFPF
jgi:hypothetical protein